MQSEALILRSLADTYSQALGDINMAIETDYLAIQALTDQIDQLDPGDPQIPILISRRRSKVYQKAYQEALRGQVSTILNQLQTRQYLTVADYLQTCYTDGFIGSIFDLHGQGIPIIVPIDQQAIVRAVQLDSKISEGLYTRMGQDVNTLKRRITAEISRCMANGTNYSQCAKQLEARAKIGYNNAARIARTEGHRIQTTATMDACLAAKERGADVVKQWDATMDGVTRKSHAAVDGEVRELDKPFSNGLMYPGDSRGPAKEVIDCRCALLQRARWALDKSELQKLQARAAYFGLDKARRFEDFRRIYMDATAA